MVAFLSIRAAKSARKHALNMSYTLIRNWRLCCLFLAGLGTPFGHTSPCLLLGTYFFSFCQSCSQRLFTGAHPAFPRLGCKSSGLSSGQNLVFLMGTCRLLRTGGVRLFGLPGRLPGHLHPVCTPRARSFAHQRFLWCIGGSNSTSREFVFRHCSCLLTKGGSKHHRHRPKGTTITNMSSVQHADPGCSK